MCRRQELPELRPRVFLLPGWPNDREAATFATALSASDGAVVTGWGALAQLGLAATWPRRTELLVPTTHRTSNLPGVRTRWTSALPAEAIIDVQGVRFTDAARSLVHLADRTALPRLRALGLDAMGKRLLTVAALERELDVRRRFPGRGVVRQLARDLRGDGSESGFEFDTRERLAALGLVPDTEQPVVDTRDGRQRRIDIAFGDRQVGIECLGFAYHSSAEQLESDVIRSNEIAELDRWLILRLTFGMFHQRWQPFVSQLRRCLASRGSRRGATG